MNRTLTLREKVLIYILCCTVVFTAVVLLLLMPGISKHTTASESLNTALEKKQTADDAINNKEALENKYDSLKEAFSSLAGEYYSTMEPEEADVVLSGMVSRYGFTPTSLEISPIAATTVQTYVPGSSASSGEAAAEGEKTNASDNTLNSYTMTIKGSGTNNQFAALCAEICLNKSMHLVSYSFNAVSTEEDVNSASQGTTSGSSTTNRSDDTDTTDTNKTTANSTTSTKSTTESTNTTTRTQTTYEVTITVELYTYAGSTELGNNDFNLDSGSSTSNNEDSKTDTDEEQGNNTNGGTSGTASNNTTTTDTKKTDTASADYVLDTSTGYFHLATCSKVKSIADANKRIFLSATMQDMTGSGYKACSECIK